MKYIYALATIFASPAVLAESVQSQVIYRYQKVATQVEDSINEHSHTSYAEYGYALKPIDVSTQPYGLATFLQRTDVLGIGFASKREEFTGNDRREYKGKGFTAYGRYHLLNSDLRLILEIARQNEKRNSRIELEDNLFDVYQGQDTREAQSGTIEASYYLKDTTLFSMKYDNDLQREQLDGQLSNTFLSYDLLYEYHTRTHSVAASLDHVERVNEDYYVRFTVSRDRSISKTSGDRSEKASIDVTSSVVSQLFVKQNLSLGAGYSYADDVRLYSAGVSYFFNHQFGFSTNYSSLDLELDDSTQVDAELWHLEALYRF
jgi:hypothetical protein